MMRVLNSTLEETMTRRKISKDVAAARPDKVKWDKKTLRDLTPEAEGPKGGIRGGIKSITCIPPPTVTCGPPKTARTL